jgi:hypothetical protein
MTAATAGAQNPPATINVDASSDRRLIRPNIYGVAYGDSTTLADLNVPLNRSGGNNTSRYNWQLNADNRGSDWYFESVPYASSVAGEVGDTFIAQSRSAGAEPMLTIPMVGWVAKLGSSRSKLASFSIAKYGAQSGNDWQWFPDAGNGVRLNGQDVTGNDPNDANVPADSAYQLGWMQHLTSRWGPAGAGGLRYYLLDNEPSIWFSTHRDVHPTGPTMEEVRDKIVDYARQVKNNDPGVLVVAPEEWGWDGYFWSGYDQQWGSQHGWSNLPDRAAHGGWDYLPWLLDQLRRQSATDGRRLLDVFSVHYYPQGGEFSDTVTPSMQLLRNVSTRSLWDPSYVDQSWIADRVQLVPRLRGWVDAYYPGTRIAVTEYNWGAEGHINGATAHADVLGIFGREGLDLAARWTTPAATTPTYKAIKMYRNYDGNRSTFGDTNVRATGPNPDVMAPFAAIRTADGALTIMVVTKYLSGSTPTTISIANFAAGSSARAWQLTAANTIARLADLPVSGGRLSITLPPQSITLLVVPVAPEVATIVAAVLPLSRSVQVGGTPATAFAAIINPGSTTAVNCAPAPPASPPAGLGTFTYQTTTAANALTGMPNTPANIAPGAIQNYVFGFSPTAAIPETSLAMRFVCDNTAPAPQTPGVNNLFIVADTAPVPDTIALMATVSGDGVVRIPVPSATQLFAIGTSNVGATGTIVVSGDTGGVTLPLTLMVCETTGGSTCLAPPTPAVTGSYAAGTNRSFAFFAQASGSIPFDPANHRVFARLTQAGVLRGATSAAVCTAPNAGC